MSAHASHAAYPGCRTDISATITVSGPMTVVVSYMAPGASDSSSVVFGAPDTLTVDLATVDVIADGSVTVTADGLSDTALFNADAECTPTEPTDEPVAPAPYPDALRSRDQGPGPVVSDQLTGIRP